MNIGIIIQARLGSTRLPNKIMLDFFNGKSILELLHKRFSLETNYEIIVATTTNVKDDKLVNFCKTNKIKYYRGDEDNVLARFIDTAKRFNMTHIIRVCSDNPFIYVRDINKMTRVLLKYPDADYISFKINGIPSILTHYGFWVELVSLRALFIVAESDDNKSCEHVTSYIYMNEGKFNIKWLKPSKMAIKKNMVIRLTVDTYDDFVNAQSLYKITGESFSPYSVIEMVNDMSDIRDRMLLQITENKK